MKKVSLLLGTLGGALAGYILSNDKLRAELSSAKDPEALAKALGTHLSKDGKKIAKEVKTFVESDDVQKNVTKAKAFATAKFMEGQKQIQKMMKAGSWTAEKAAKGAAKSAASKMKKKAMKIERKAV